MFFRKPKRIVHKLLATLASLAGVAGSRNRLPSGMYRSQQLDKKDPRWRRS